MLLDGVTSSAIGVTSSVPQSSILVGPTAILALGVQCSPSQLGSFTDDIIYLKPVYSDEDISTLQT